MLEPHERALTLIGVPFRHQGRDASIGVDCLGVVTCAFKLPLPDVPRYKNTDGTWQSIEDGLSPWFDPCDGRRATNNDIIVFRLPRSFHFGVVSGAFLIHADLKAGRVVARRLPARLGPECRTFEFRGV